MRFKDTKYGDLSGQTYEGDIDVSMHSLTSLEGAPKKVIGKFDCSSNKLTSLEYGPEIVTGVFECSNCNLESFMFSPKYIGDTLSASFNYIKSLKGLPEVINGSLLIERIGIESFDEYFPKKIAGTLNCNDNSLKSLEGVGHIEKNIYCAYNQLTDFNGLQTRITGHIDCSANRIMDLNTLPFVEGTLLADDNPNPYLEMEFKVRKENPYLSNEDIFAIMLEKTGYEHYASKEIKEIFLF